ncbi:unnamed protein product [Merluccius merluccius]
MLELLDHSVSDDMRRQPGGLESELLRKYAFQLLRAMEYLHRNNVIHRDIKPSNLLVSGSGVVKVADLGSGRLVYTGTTTPLLVYPGKGQIMSLGMGTLWYLSPKSLTGDRFYSMSHDVWAIGCTILAMAHSKPFIRSFSHYHQIMMEVYRVGYLTKQQEQGFTKTYPGYELPQCKGRIPPADLQLKYHLSDSVLAQLISHQLDSDSRTSYAKELVQQVATARPTSYTEELVQQVATARPTSCAEELVLWVVTAMPDDGLCSTWSLAECTPEPSITEYQKKGGFKSGCRRILRRIRRCIRHGASLQMVPDWITQLLSNFFSCDSFPPEVTHLSASTFSEQELSMSITLGK